MLFLHTGFAQLNFNVSNVTGLHEQFKNPTTLQFGPDGKLYVGTEGGRLFVCTINKTGANSYAITNTQVIYLVAQIPNHNDDGSLYTYIFETRQVTGLLVAGTAANPVIYVSSSDPRVGGGGTAGDLNLDTNSGIVSKLTWNGSAWEKVDIVRGLPRSEENHSVNGLQLDKTTNSLYLAVGGITNAGAPSNNFAFLTEYAYSAAIVKIDLNVINSLPVRGTGNNKYVYDIPTLNDPTRPDVANPDYNPSLQGSPQIIDQDDPFGGNDGMNQAKIVPGGPVSIYSPGYRNSYDLLIMKTGSRAGFLYTIDNGANDGWGGYPKNVGTASANNDYDPLEPGSTSSAGTLGPVNNLDNLHLVSKPGMAPIYGGHPNPIRANPAGAGLYYHDGTTGAFLTAPAQLPSDWPPVPLAQANPVEGNFLMPGVNDNALATFLTSTNGMAEYTSTNYFNGQLTGDILTADFLGKIWRIKLSADGTQVVSKEIFASGFGEIALDVTTQGNGEIFDGTIWACDYTGSKLFVFTPDAGTVNCSGNTTSTTLDDDGDGYSNKDETDNGTDPCNPVSIPADFDNDRLSDKNDNDDDNDGIPDVADAFYHDAQNGQATATTLQYPFLNNNPGTGLFGLGFTGLMTDGNTDPDHLFDIDNPGLVMGGAVGLASFPADQGTAVTNTQKNGFQFGYKTGNGAPSFEVQSLLMAPFFNGLAASQLNQNHVQGIYIGTGDQDNYLMAAVSGASGGATPGIRIRVENAGTLTKNTFLPVSGILDVATIQISLFVNPVTGKITVKYNTNVDDSWKTVEADIAISGPLLTKLQSASAVALGLMASSGTATTFSARYDYLNVVAPAPLVITPIEDFELNINPPNKVLNLSGTFDDDEGLANITLSIAGNTNPSLVTSATFTGKNLTLAFAANKTGTAKIRVRATDSDGYWVEEEFEVDVVAPPPASAIRINNGGPALSMGSWIADQYFEGGETFAEWVPIEGTLNDAMYQDERWGDFKYKVPVPNGNYKVVLHFVELYWTEAGHRLFNVDIESGQGTLTNYDIFTSAGGMNIALAEEFKNITVTDGFMDINFISISDNAKVSGIEIIPVAPPTVVKSLPDIEVNINTASKTVALANVFADNGGAAGLTLTVSGNSNTALIKTATITGTTLTLGITAGAVGSSNIRIKATDADGLSAEDEFTITVINPPPPNTKPVVAKPLPDLKLNTNSADKQISLSDVFTDDQLVDKLKITVVSNGNTALVTSALVSGNILTLKFAKDKTGEALITIRATDEGGLFENDEFKITVSEPVIPPGPPSVAKPLQDLSYYINPGTQKIDISEVFSDAKGTAGLRFSITSNSNTALLTTSFTSTVLNLAIAANKSGIATLKLRATNAAGLYAEDEFKVTVLGTSQPKAPYIVAPIPDLNLTINPANVSIDLLKVYGDDKPTTLLKHTITDVTNKDLLPSATITGKTLNLRFAKNKSGNGIVRLRATDADGLYADEYFRYSVSPAKAPVLVSPVKDVVVNMNAPDVIVDLSKTYSDDKLVSGLKHTITQNTIPGVVTATVVKDKITLRFVKGKWGKGMIRIRATDAEGLFADEYFYVTVNGPVAPKLVAPIPDVTVYMNAADRLIDLSKVYSDDKPVSQLKHTIIQNTNPGLLKAVITGSTLRLGFNTGKTGEGIIRIKATDADGMSVEEYFKVKVLAPAIPPTVVKPIADQTTFVNADKITLNISQVFSDDKGAANLKYLVTSNSNAGVVTTSLTGTTLALTPVANAVGTAAIRIQATDNDGLSAVDEFLVNVGFNSILINSGGPEIVLEGRTWLKDYFYDDGRSDAERANVTNTTNDLLYQSFRKGDFDYSIPVPNGTYTVKLHFAEFSQRLLWKRYFNVYIEKNQGVLKNYEIAGKAGGVNKAIVETFANIKVEDGRLNLEFDRGTDDAVLGGIEIIPVSIVNLYPAVIKPIPDQWYLRNSSDKKIDLSDHFSDDQGESGLEYSIRSNSNSKLVELKLDDEGGVNKGDRNGNGELEMEFKKNQTGVSAIRLRATDLLGFYAEDEFKVEIGLTNPGQPKQYRINSGGSRLLYGNEEWVADESFAGGSAYKVWLPVSGSDMDNMYQDIRYGKSFRYRIPMTKGKYDIVLHFVEVSLNYKNGRIFNVNIENGQGKLTNYDIIGKWGLNFHAVKETFRNITVNDGYLDINFEGVKDNAVISGIEILEVRENNADDHRLAIESELDATAVDSTARLNWTYQFDSKAIAETVEIERSADGEHYQTITELAANLKNGKSGSFTDLTPVTGANYYRLRFSNSSGMVAYSNVRTVTITPRLYGLMIYPNPNLTGVVFAELGRQDKEKISVRLMDINGKVITSNPEVQRTSHVLIRIKLPAAIAKGIYFLEIHANGKTYHNRLVIQ